MSKEKKENPETLDENIKDTNDTEIENTKSEPDETPESDDTEENEKKNYTVFIIEGIIALVAIGFIIFALVSNSGQNDSASGNNITSGNTVSGQSTDVMNPTGAIDNSVLYTELPAIPAVAEINTLSESDCEAAVAEGTMIKLENADGTYVYVNNYTNAEYFTEQTTVSEDMVNEMIFHDILINFATAEETDHTSAEEWDIVSVNYVGYMDGEAFEGGTGSDPQLIIGAGNYIPGFEEGIIGMAVGETKSIDVTFPEDYHAPDLAGKAVVFDITLNEITSTLVIPELSDELVQQAFSDITTAEECIAYYEENLIKSCVYDFICKDFYVSALSEDMVLSYYDVTMSYYEQMSTMYGISVEELIASGGMSIDIFKSEVMQTSADSAKYVAMYQAIANTADITVTEDDIKNLAVEYGYVDANGNGDLDSFYIDYGEQIVHDFILESKVVDYIITLRQ